MLGRATSPAAVALRDQGVPVHALRLRHWLDVSGMRQIRHVIGAANPTVVHAWGPAAVRVSRLVTRATPDGGNTPRLVASAADVPGSGPSGWATGRRLRRADRVVAATWAEANRYRRLGVAAERLTRISPAVALPRATPDPVAFRRELGLPPGSRLIMTAGRIEPSAGMKAAVWGFDMLRYEAPDLHLVIFGDGPDRAGLEAFGRALAFDDFRVVFAGCRSDLPAVLGLAEVVWVPRDRGGVTLAIEAMAAGRPVVGWQTPELTEVIEPGVTGFLAPIGERAMLSELTHPLIHTPGLGTQIGAAGHARAAERFGVARQVEHFARLYLEIAASE